MQMSVPRFEADALDRLPQSSLLFSRGKSPDFRVPLKTTRHRSHQLVQEMWIVILLKDQTQTNNGTSDKNIRRRLRLVSIQRPRAKRPEEKGIQDKMRLGFVSIQRSCVKSPQEKDIQDKMRLTP